MSNYYRPNMYLKDIYQIPIKDLKQRKIKALVFDLDKKGYFTVDAETRETSIPAIFAGGDVAPVGESNAINAMGAGKKAAKAINEYLANK